MYVRLDFEKYKNIVNYHEILVCDTPCTVTEIPKIVSHNERVFPRVKILNDESLKDFMDREEVLFAVNGGIFNTGTREAECVLVKNKKILKDEKETYIHTRPEDGGEKRDELFILGITMDGDFKVFEPSVRAEEVVASGCVDAVMGFVPLMLEGHFVDYDARCKYISMGRHPRQIVGQDINGDFVVFSVKKPGLTLQEAREMLSGYNIVIAYNLDGGKSTQTVYHKESLLPVYVGNSGRHIPTAITFEIITGELSLE